MKTGFSKFVAFMKKYAFYPIAIIALLLPDIQLKFLVTPKLNGEVADIVIYNAIIPAVFDICWITLFLHFSRVFLPKRWGRLVFVLFGAVFIVFSFAQYVYFGIFGMFFRVSSIGLAGEGTDYLDYALSYIDGWTLTFSLTAIFGLILTALLWERSKDTGRRAKLHTLIPVGGLVLIHIIMQPGLFTNDEQDWDSWSKPRVIYEQFTDANKAMDVAGVYQFAFRDFFKTYIAGTQFTKEDYESVDEFFAKKEAEYKPNEYTGMFEGKNVIAVMLEGIDDWMIDEKYTPTMCYMMENGINFLDYYAPQFGSGLTLGSEFCFNTGYYTPKSGINPVNYIGNHYPYSLPNLFAEKGYSVNSFHYNNAEFYSRGMLHKSLGYEKYHSFMDYGLPEHDAIVDSNILLYDEIYNDIVKDEPFFSFVITYSGHIPYVYEDAKLYQAKLMHPERIDPQMDPETNHCYILAGDTDDFFKMLLERLHATGKLEDTVIVAFTDHNAYGFSDTDKLKQYSIEAGSENVHRVPAFIYNYGTEPMDISKPCKTADWVPTLINLFGLENHHCYVGNDILSPENTGFAYFGTYSWISETWTHDYTKPEREQDKEINYQGRLKVKELLIINDIVVAGDYFDKRR